MSSQFSPNERFDRVFLLKAIDERQTKAGKPYLTMVLGTSEGTWDGRVWDMGMSSLPGLLEGDPVQAKGTAQLYQEKIQLILEDISKVDKPVDPRTIYPGTGASEKQLREEFGGYVDGVKDPALRALMEIMLKDKTISDAFFTCPAAISMHHARIGGLAEHSLNVCRFAHASAAAAPWLDLDLLTAGALLHDIGKIQEYEVAGDFRFTLEGKFLGHIVQGHSMVEKWISQIPDFPERLALDVLHIILSHHGQLEYGSPKTPATAEALVIHFADDMDAKLDMIKTAGEEPGTEEAFVRGLRRSFQFREGTQDTETRGPSFASTDAEAMVDREATDGKHGDTEKGEEKTPERESGREGEGNSDAETRGHGDTEKISEDEELSEVKKKKRGQEELF
jgi:3'-5' exoribonuclease